MAYVFYIIIIALIVMFVVAFFEIILVGLFIYSIFKFFKWLLFEH